jgi:uncharacterized protein
MAKTFLQAEWRKLAMANYVVDPALLKEYLPNKTEIDLWQNKCYVSLVGFMFVNTAVLGLKIPFHINFEEVNLRFYVRYNDKGEWKRGVVFIKEIVPRPALTFIANAVYGENYETMQMRHLWSMADEELTVEYQWKKRQWNSFRVVTSQEPDIIAAGSEEEFITEHYWGYTKLSEKRTSEYGVEHPTWRVYRTKGYSIDVNFKDIYGEEFGFLSNEHPKSVFLAEGSEIRVMGGRKI